MIFTKTYCKCNHYFFYLYLQIYMVRGEEIIRLHTYKFFLEFSISNGKWNPCEITLFSICQDKLSQDCMYQAEIANKYSGLQSIRASKNQTSNAILRYEYLLFTHRFCCYLNEICRVSKIYTSRDVQLINLA